MKYIDLKNQDDKVNRKYLEKNDKFNFLCHEKLTCFNRCCRNLNMFLYPYDIVRLKKNISKTSNYFIENHVDVIIRNGNYFPDVLLRMNSDDQMKCPFLRTNGCSIYEDRPYSCRTFPLEQGALYDPTSESVKIVNFFKPPNFCLGQNESIEWITKTWIENQNSKLYTDMTVRWSNVKKLFHINPWGVDGHNSIKAKMAFMAAYNIDNFRKFIFESSFLKRYKVKNKTLNKIKNSEIELLKLGLDWIKLFVWGIKSSTIIIR